MYGVNRRNCFYTPRSHTVPKLQYSPVLSGDGKHSPRRLKVSCRRLKSDAATRLCQERRVDPRGGARDSYDSFLGVKVEEAQGEAIGNWLRGFRRGMRKRKAGEVRHGLVP